MPNAKVQEQEKPINSDRSQNSGFLWEVLTGNTEGTFWVTGNVLYLDPAGEFTWSNSLSRTLYVTPQSRCFSKIINILKC